jgi:hypothetical protein
MPDNQNPSFVTGGTGLLGSHLLFALAKQGEKPRAVYRSEVKKDLVRKIFSYYCDKPAITSENLSSAWSTQIFDNSRIIRETGIGFIPVRRSIEDTCRIYLKEKSVIQ